MIVFKLDVEHVQRSILEKQEYSDFVQQTECPRVLGYWTIENDLKANVQ